MTTEHVDVLVVGAGLSGIGAGYHLQTRCPKLSYAILEGRDTIGGTWDLFRYPGIRSDSDMHTLGYPFHPWRGAQSIADGASILEYIRDTAKTYGIDRKIRFGHRVISASWSSDAARWTVEVTREGGETKRFTCRFLFMCSGYYNYESGYTPELAGIESYGGQVIHPQKWTPDIDVSGKRVIVIGSGATAVTLVPELAKTAAHVTMLQRSPTYVISLPDVDPIAKGLGKALPRNLGHDVARWKNVALATAMFQFCRAYPERAKKFLVGQVRRRVGETLDVDTHFTPSYAPWDQRLCFVPNGDLFKVIRKGKADVVTDHIDTFTAKGIRLRSGRELEADVVVTATGLRLLMLGGTKLFVDGAPVNVGKTTSYKGAMLSGVPNFAVALGYTNASWTLKSDLVCQYVCRILNDMDRKGYRTCTPEVRPEDTTDEPLLGLSSGYVHRSIAELPKQGVRAPWRLYQNYFLDLVGLRYGSVEDGALQFQR